MKSKLFPGPSSRPKRVFASAAGTSEYKHVLPNEDGYKDGMVGWRAGRSAGGEKGASRQVPPPMHGAGEGEGGLAWDSSMSGAMTDKNKP